jgi:hypothetical protein
VHQKIAPDDRRVVIGWIFFIRVSSVKGIRNNYIIIIYNKYTTYLHSDYYFVVRKIKRGQEGVERGRTPSQRGRTAP